MKIVAIVLLILVLAIVALFGTRSYLSRSSPPTLDLVQGKLRPCPASPNCVSSEGEEGDHAIAALPYRGDRAASELALTAALSSLPRTTIQRRQGDYWHAMQVSGVFRFIDDIEIRFDDAGGQIHLRSGSRVGYSDLGVNRKRSEALRAAYLAQP